MKEKNYIIEFLRFFFTMGVVVGHAYNIFFMGKSPSYTIQFPNACVDFFFVLSGFFLASHFVPVVSGNAEAGEAYIKYNFQRIRLLFPLLVVAALEGIVYEALRGHFYAEKWGTFFFLGGVNKFKGWNVIWYITSLFWCSLASSALLCRFKKSAVFVHLPLIAFISLSVMNYWGCSNLGGVPLLDDWFSAGLVRGMCGISFGIESYYLSLYAKKNIGRVRKGALGFFSVSIEVFFILLVIYLAVKQKFNNKEFLMFFAASALLLVLNLKQQIVFRCLNQSFWAKFGKISSMIYVTHFYLEKGFEKISAVKNLPDVALYALCALSSCLLGAVVFVIEKKCEKIFSGLFLKD